MIVDIGHGRRCFAVTHNSLLFRKENNPSLYGRWREWSWIGECFTTAGKLYGTVVYSGQNTPKVVFDRLIHEYEVIVVENEKWITEANGSKCVKCCRRHVVRNNKKSNPR